MSNYNKYIKYKNKYLILKELIGGTMKIGDFVMMYDINETGGLYGVIINIDADIVTIYIIESDTIKTLDNKNRINSSIGQVKDMKDKKLNIAWSFCPNDSFSFAFPDYKNQLIYKKYIEKKEKIEKLIEEVKLLQRGQPTEQRGPAERGQAEQRGQPAEQRGQLLGQIAQPLKIGDIVFNINGIIIGIITEVNTETVGITDDEGSYYTKPINMGILKGRFSHTDESMLIKKGFDRNELWLYCDASIWLDFLDEDIDNMKNKKIYDIILSKIQRRAQQQEQEQLQRRAQQQQEQFRQEQERFRQEKEERVRQEKERELHRRAQQQEQERELHRRAEPAEQLRQKKELKTWTCPICTVTGNTSEYCITCNSPKPVIEKELQRRTGEERERELQRRTEQEKILKRRELEKSEMQDMAIRFRSTKSVESVEKQDIIDIIIVRHADRQDEPYASEQAQAEQEKELATLAKANEVTDKGPLYSSNLYDTPLDKMRSNETIDTFIRAFALRAFKFDAIYSSPMRRCIETALQIKKQIKYKDGIKIRKELIEVWAPEKLFAPIRIIEQYIPRKIEAYKQLPDIDKTEEDDSELPHEKERFNISDDYYRRFKRAFTNIVDICKSKNYKQILIVCHADFQQIIWDFIEKVFAIANTGYCASFHVTYNTRTGEYKIINIHNIAFYSI